MPTRPIKYNPPEPLQRPKDYESIKEMVLFQSEWERHLSILHYAKSFASNNNDSVMFRWANTEIYNLLNKIDAAKRDGKWV